MNATTTPFRPTTFCGCVLVLWMLCRCVLLPSACVALALPAAHRTALGSDKAASELSAPVFVIADRSDQPLLKADRPWESFFIGWVQVMRVDGKWRLWYLSASQTYKDDGDGYLCYAESDDGVTWVKPDLGLVVFDGSRKNNILLDSKDVGGVQGHMIVHDIDAPPAERYKLTIIKPSPNKEHFWIYAMVSADGLRFTAIPEPIFRFNSDTQNTLVREKDCWRMYVRMWDPHLWSGERVVGLSESKDFTNFPAPRIVLRRDANDPKELQFYNPALSKLNDRLWVMLPSAFMTQQNTVVPHLAWSRDGEHFTRVGSEPFLPLRADAFDSQSIYVGPGAVPGPRPDTWWFYYTASVHGHDNPTKEKRSYQQAMGRFLLEVDVADKGFTDPN